MATISSTISLVDNMSEKLNTIKSSAEGVATQMEGIGTSATTAQSAVNGFSWAQFSSRCVAAGKSISKIGNQMTLAITAPLLLLGKKVYGTATDYETAFAGVRKTTDATEEEFQSLYDGMLQMSETETSVGFIDLSEIMETAGQLGVASDELLGFTKIYADLQESTNIQGSEGAASLAQFLNITEQGTQNIGRVGGVIVDLGNKFATTEADILSMATRMASTGDLTGFTSAEILGLSAALSSVGINAEAGGSAAGKLMKQMQIAAEVGGQAETMLSGNYGTALDFSYFISSKDNLLEVAQELGVTTDYVETMGNAWTQLDYFSKISGKTAGQFQSDWSDKPAQGMLDFFVGLGQLDEGGSQSAISMLNEMGITEIRLSNLVGAMSTNTELYKNALALAYAAYADDPFDNALSEEAAKRYATQESQNDMLGNKLSNSMADLGTNLISALQPALDMVNSLLDSFNALSEADQDKVLQAFMIFAAAGPVCKVVGETITVIGKVSGAMDKIITSHGGWKSSLTAMFGSSAFWGIAAGAGILLLISYLDSIPTKLENIITSAASIPLTFDQESVTQALDQIAQVQSGLDLLNGNEQTQEAANASQAVKMGYGTQNMYNSALAYESASVNAEIEKIITDYSSLIHEAEIEISRAATDAERNTWLTTAQSLEGQMNSEVSAARERYSTTISELFNGMAAQFPESAAALEKAAKQYDFMSLMQNVSNFEWGDNDAADTIAWNNMMKNMYGKAFDLGYMSDSGLTLEQVEGQIDFGMMPNAGWIMDFETAVSDDLKTSVQNLSDNPMLSTLLQTILQSDTVTENLDLTAVQGALDGMVGTLDFAQAAQKAVESGEPAKFGEYLVLGLADGVTNNAGLIEPSFASVRDAALAALASAFMMHSPSQLMAEQGIYIPEGLALGILNGVPVVSAAIMSLGTVVVGNIVTISNQAVQNASSILSYSQGHSIGSQIAAGMAGGIRSGSGAVAAAARALAASAVAATRSSLGIHSPSTVYYDLATMTGKGYINGQYDMRGEIEKSTYGMLSVANSAMNEGVWSNIGMFADLENQKFLADDKTKVKISDTDIKKIRDLAERESINQYTTAELHIDFTANNKIDSNLDLDGVVTYLQDKVAERLEMVAEGVYE